MSKVQGKQTRRNFLGRVIAGWVAMLFMPVAYVIVKYIIPPVVQESLAKSVFAVKLSKLPVNTAKLIRYNKKPVIVLHEPDGSIKAFTAVCTHLGCVVSYDQAAQKIHCYCHDSIYDLDGKNIGGPARFPLAPYKVIVANDDISVADSTNKFGIRNSEFGIKNMGITSDK